MSASEWVAIGLAVFTLLFGIIGYLLNRKDQKQDELIKEQHAEHLKQIEDLYRKHEDDAKKLAALEVDIAKNYNPKHEVAELFSSFQRYLNERFDRLEQAIGVERKTRP